jgi:zinc transport system substrate-binding protein
MQARTILISAALVLVAAGCAQGDREPDVVAGFYPLAWAAEQIGGAGLDVVDLTPPGAEPHDLEPRPSDVGLIRDAGLVLYVRGFQPALDRALEQRDGPSLDAGGGAARTDPHVWLDPHRFATVARAIGAELDRTEAAERLARRLGALDREFSNGLAICERREIVTSHAAFGRLAARYGLRQVSLAGVSPEAEPTPRSLEALVEAVRATAATTVFTEPLLSPRVAETVARETGAKTAVLDPVEALGPEQQKRGDDYVSIMRRNLATLRTALGCR